MALMKAVRFYEYGGPDVLQVVDIEEPRVGPGEVRIAVRAAGVNPSDWKDRSGEARDAAPVELPSGVGFEASGVVNDVGPGVSNVSIGDAVFGYGRDTAAEIAVLSHWALKPEELSFEIAGGLPVVAETAWRCLEQMGMKAGQTLLVSGAAGGVGSAVLQLARLRGILVIGTASAAKHDYVRGLGAIPTTYGPGLAQRVVGLAPGGVHAALDVAGSAVIPDLIGIVGDPSRVFSVADVDAPKYGARFCHGPPKDPERVFAEVARLCSKGLFRLHIERTFPLEQTSLAQALSAEGHVTGKLVLCIPPPVAFDATEERSRP
jgi:NADPH:quinone reductase-like Zn-dependent oxidoreductase